MHKFILEIKINGPNSRKTSIFGRLTKNKENMFSCYLRPPALWVSLAQEGTSCMLIVCIADNREVQEISREKSRFFHSFIKVKIVHISLLVLFHLDSLFWINFLPRIVAKQLSHWTLCHAKFHLQHWVTQLCKRTGQFFKVNFCNQYWTTKL